MHRSLPVTPPALVGSFFVVFLYPHIEVDLQFLQSVAGFLAKGDTVELIEYRLVKPLADLIGLRTPGFRSRVVDVLHGQVELVLMVPWTPTIPLFCSNSRLTLPFGVGSLESQDVGEGVKGVVVTGG